MATETISDICQSPSTSATRTSTSRQGERQKSSSSSQVRFDKMQIPSSLPETINSGGMKHEKVGGSTQKRRKTSLVTDPVANLEKSVSRLSTVVDELQGKVAEAFHSGLGIDARNKAARSQRYQKELLQGSLGLPPEISSLFERVQGEVAEIRTLSSRTAVTNAHQSADPKKMLLRDQVEAMVAEFVAVDESLSDREEKRHNKLLLLHKYGIPKWVGKRKNGGVTAHEFLKRYYGHWIDEGVIFKSDVRRMDRDLVAQIGEDSRNYKRHDPLMAEKERTEMFATGVLGEKRQILAQATLAGRVAYGGRA